MMAAAMLRSLVGRPSGRVWTALRMGGLAVGLIHICCRRGIARRCKGEADGDGRGTGCAYEGCARHDAILPVLAS